MEHEKESKVRLTFESWVDLECALSNACVSASTDRARPILSAVLFEPHEDGVRIVATDSYVLTWETIPADGVIDGPVLIDRAGVVDVVKALKRKPVGEIMLEVADGVATFTAADWSIRCCVFAGQFPAWESLVDGAAGDGRTAGAFTAAMFARLGKFRAARTRPANTALVFELGADRMSAPARFRICGSTFAGLVMPHRID